MTIARTAEQFWAHVQKGPSCWLWTGSTNGDGYGTCTGPDGTKSAHRAAYVFQHGPIPPGALICHHCDVRNCVRGDHLYAGDTKSNGRDVRERNRAYRAFGDQSASRRMKARLEELVGLQETAAYWREVREAHGMTVPQFASVLGLTPQTVQRIEAGCGFPQTGTWRALHELTGVSGWSVLRERKEAAQEHSPLLYTQPPTPAIDSAR